MHKAKITARRIKILKLIAKSYNNKQIAQFLNLSLSNTKLQKSRLYNYLGVNKAKDAIECGLQIGLINLNDMQDL